MRIVDEEGEVERGEIGSEVGSFKVFPAVDACCAAKGYQFLPPDLR
jgi:hypothetical protein